MSGMKEEMEISVGDENRERHSGACKPNKLNRKEKKNKK